MGLFSWMFGKKDKSIKTVWKSKKDIRHIMKNAEWIIANDTDSSFNFDRDKYICPTLDEVKSFLYHNKIDKKVSTDSFRCGEFAKTLHLEAAKKDWAFAAVKVHHFFEGTYTHWVNLVIINTGETKWIEPQNDFIYDYKREFSVIIGDFS